MQAFEEEITPLAEQRLKESLALVELAQVEDIQIDPEEVRSETARTVEMLSQSMSEKEMRQLSSERALSNMYSSVMVDLVTRRAYERLREIASGGASKISVESSETTVVVDEVAAVNEPAEEPADLQAQPDETPAVE
jgi:hypothetical protein